MQTVNNVNNDIDLNASSMNNDNNSNVCMNNIDSSVNSTNNDITKDQSSSGYVSKLTGFRVLDLEILSAFVSSLCCCSTCNQV